MSNTQRFPRDTSDADLALQMLAEAETAAEADLRDTGDLAFAQWWLDSIRHAIWDIERRRIRLDGSLTRDTIDTTLSVVSDRRDDRVFALLSAADHGHQQEADRLERELDHIDHIMDDLRYDFDNI